MNKRIASWKVRTGGQVKAKVEDVEAGLGKVHSLMGVKHRIQSGLELAGWRWRKGWQRLGPKEDSGVHL